MPEQERTEALHTFNETATPDKLEEGLQRVIDTQEAALITRQGRVAAAIIPITAEKLVQMRFYRNPEFRQTLEAAERELQSEQFTAADEDFGAQQQ